MRSYFTIISNNRKCQMKKDMIIVAEMCIMMIVCFSFCFRGGIADFMIDNVCLCVVYRAVETRRGECLLEETKK